MFGSLLRKFSIRNHRRLSRKLWSCWVRLRVEPLDERVLPSVAAGLSQGILSIAADDGPNAVQVLQPSDQQIQVLESGNLVGTFAANQVQLLAFRYGAGISTFDNETAVHAKELRLFNSPQLTPDQLNQTGTLDALLIDNSLTLTGPSGAGFEILGPWMASGDATHHLFSASGTLTLKTALGDLPFQVPDATPLTIQATGSVNADFGAVNSVRWVSNLVDTTSGPLSQFASEFGLQVSPGSATLNVTLGSGLAGLGAPVNNALPYITLTSTTGTAQFGDLTAQINTSNPLTVALDPEDPFLFAQVHEFAAAGSLKGYIPYTPTYSLPDLQGSPLYGHLFGRGTVAFGDVSGGVTGSVVLNLDAGQDSALLSQLQGNVASQLLTGRTTLSDVAENAPYDLQAGFNGQMNITSTAGGFAISFPAAVSADYVPGNLAVHGTPVGSPFQGTPLAWLTFSGTADMAAQYPAGANATVNLSGAAGKIAGYSVTGLGVGLSDQGVTVNATLDPALGLGAVAFQGIVQADGSWSSSGPATVTAAGFSLAGATATLRNTGLSLAGQVNVPGMAPVNLSGAVDVTGQFSLAGSTNFIVSGIAVNAGLTLTPMRLSVAAGVTIPEVGTGVVFGVLMPDGTINWTGTNRLTIGGFTMDTNLTLTNSGLDAAGSLTLPGIGRVTLDGTATREGVLLLAGISQFTAAGVPVDATLILTPGGLTLMAPLTIPNVGTLTFSGAVISTGQFVLRAQAHATVASLPVAFNFQLTNTTLTGAAGVYLPVFGPAQLTGVVGSGGQFQLTAALFDTAEAGFSLTSSTATLTNTSLAIASVMTVPSVGAVHVSGSPNGPMQLALTGTSPLNLAGFATTAGFTLTGNGLAVAGDVDVRLDSVTRVHFTGTGSSAGSFQLTGTAAVTLAGFAPAGAARFTLTNDALALAGDFNVRLDTNTVRVTLQGADNPSGRFQLTGMASVVLAEYQTSGLGGFTLTNDGLALAGDMAVQLDPFTAQVHLSGTASPNSHFQLTGTAAPLLAGHQATGGVQFTVTQDNLTVSGIVEVQLDAFAAYVNLAGTVSPAGRFQLNGMATDATTGNVQQLVITPTATLPNNLFVLGRDAEVTQRISAGWKVVDHFVASLAVNADGTLQTTYDAIGQKWLALGGTSSVVGQPTAAEQVASDHVGRIGLFQSGAIYWTAPTGTHEVHGAIYDKFVALGGLGSLLGYPVTDQANTADGAGRVSHFQGGDIYWSSASAAHEIHGPILTKYTSLGGPGSILGLPTSDVAGIPAGQVSHLQGGDIYWSAATAAHEVHGPILSKYSGPGGLSSNLGLPTGDVNQASGVQWQSFQKGFICASAAAGTDAILSQGSVADSNGDAWFLGTATVDGAGNHAIYRFNNGQFIQVAGSGTGIGVAEGSAWGVDLYNRVWRVWRWNGHSWDLRSGNVAVDGGTWFLGTAGQTVYRFRDGRLDAVATFREGTVSLSGGGQITVDYASTHSRVTYPTDGRVISETTGRGGKKITRAYASLVEFSSANPIPSGVTVQDGAMVSSPSQTAVYLIQNGIRHKIEDVTLYGKLGLKPEDINDLQDVEVGKIPLGEPLVDQAQRQEQARQAQMAAFAARQEESRQQAERIIRDSLGWVPCDKTVSMERFTLAADANHYSGSAKITLSKFWGRVPAPTLQDPHRMVDARASDDFLFTFTGDSSGLHPGTLSKAFDLRFDLDIDIDILRIHYHYHYSVGKFTVTVPIGQITDALKKFWDFVTQEGDKAAKTGSEIAREGKKTGEDIARETKNGIDSVLHTTPPGWGAIENIFRNFTSGVRKLGAALPQIANQFATLTKIDFNTGAKVPANLAPVGDIIRGLSIRGILDEQLKGVNSQLTDLNNIKDLLLQGAQGVLDGLLQVGVGFHGQTVTIDLPAFYGFKISLLGTVRTLSDVGWGGSITYTFGGFRLVFEVKEYGRVMTLAAGYKVPNILDVSATVDLQDSSIPVSVRTELTLGTFSISAQAAATGNEFLFQAVDVKFPGINKSVPVTSRLTLQVFFDGIHTVPEGERWNVNLDVRVALKVNWDFVSKAPPILPQTEQGKRLVLLVGGGGEEYVMPAFGWLDPVRDNLLKMVKELEPDADRAYFYWDQGLQAVDFVRQYLSRHPGAEIAIYGHSYGGDTAMDIANLLNQGSRVQIAQLFTLDPVSLQGHFGFQATRPANVRYWANIHIEGTSPKNPLADFIAEIGGRWPAQGDADNNDEQIVPASDISHAGALAMYKQAVVLYADWLKKHPR